MDMDLLDASPLVFFRWSAIKCRKIALLCVITGHSFSFFCIFTGGSSAAAIRAVLVCPTALRLLLCATRVCLSFVHVTT